ncbi:MAG: hypothetical protein A2252_11905 [Elusimicrobia bacterium RIFOXYA2_FULL_39_19]|nr:MAG: hypothetical protein A2252_11905 [Elusimicrobia bacterium RIFOXYA2_FULL_39_19]
MDKKIEQKFRDWARKNKEAGIPKEFEIFQSAYAHFEDNSDETGFVNNSEVHISTPNLPRPWLHLMANNHSNTRSMYGSFWDQTGKGFSFIDSVLAGPVTSHKDPSYVPTAPGPRDVRYFYLREQVPGHENPDMWFMLPQEGREEAKYTNYKCVMSAGKIQYESVSRNIAASLKVFVTAEDPLEVWQIKLKNNSLQKRIVKLYCGVSWGLESWPSYYFDPRVVSRGEIHKDLNAIVAINGDQNNKHKRTGFMMADRPFDTFDISREEFEGGGHFHEFPQAVIDGACTNSEGVQPYEGMVGVLQFDLDIPASGTVDVNILLGNTDFDQKKRKENLKQIRKKYFSAPGQLQAQEKQVEDTWQAMASSIFVDTPDEEFNRFFNVWLKYQMKNAARFTRCLDAVGYRDVLQDTMAAVDFNPEFVKNQLPETLSYQMKDGRAIRQFSRFPGAKHDERIYMDSPVWIPDLMHEYVMETGDLKILDIKTGFFNLEKHEREFNKQVSLYEHAMLGLKSLYFNRPQKGLCQVGHGDWNDAVDTVGKGKKGVSVWLSMALVFACQKMLPLAELKKDKKGIAFLNKAIKTVTDSINKNAWDGEYYVYAFNDVGRPVGSKKEEEGKIHLNVNTWSLFNGVAEKAGRVDKVLKSIEKISTHFGYLLLSPAYTAKSSYVGRISDQLPGMFENASIYTHGHVFAVYGFLALNSGTKAYKEIKKVFPSNTVNDVSTGPIHQVTNFAVGEAHAHFGKHLYSNFAGGAAWLRKCMLKIVGVEPVFNGLKINPCLPKQWKTIKVQRRFRNTVYNITIENLNEVESGVKQILVDNKPIEGNIIPISKNKSCEVKVVLG